MTILLWAAALAIAADESSPAPLPPLPALPPLPVLPAPATGDVLPKPTSPDFAVGVQLPNAPAFAAPTDEALAVVPRDGDAAADIQGRTAEAAENFRGPDRWQSIPDLLTDHLALDWGVATIGEPILYPGGGAVGMGGGRTPGGFGGGGRGGPTFVPIVIPNPPDPPGGGGNGPQPVPEPASLLLWSLVALGVWRGRAAGGTDEAPRR